MTCHNRESLDMAIVQPSVTTNGDSLDGVLIADGLGHGKGGDLPEAGDQDDSIPSHPLGILPLGNQFLAAKPSARRSIGAFRNLPDEILMLVAENLDAPALLFLGSTCRFLYAFCHLDDLWRALFISTGTCAAAKQKKKTRDTLQWMGSWRSTVLELDGEHSAHPDCSNVFSDVLHRPYACSKIHLESYAAKIPTRNRISRRGDLSYDEFAAKWTETPFILTDAVRSWPACSEWTVDSLTERHGETEFRAEAVDWPLQLYADYLRRSGEEAPLYLFDRRFVEKMAITVGRSPGDAYWKPECFGPDLFEVLGDERPAHRWLIMGPRGSGSTFHKDPNATSAWNAVVQGSKYWIMFPPGATVPGVYVSADSSEVTSPLSIAEWLLTFHDEARRRAGCVEGICGPGEVLHVPSGWWHLVVNLEEGIAITQNFVPSSPSLHHLAEVLAFLRDKPEQVSGFGDGVGDPYALFVERLQERYPGLVEKGLEVLDGRGRKRKWEEVVEATNEEARGGFSFGFGGDDEYDSE